MPEREQQSSHVVVEAFSRNKLNHSVVVIGAIPVVAVSVVLVAAVWPHLAELWLMVEAMAFTIACCVMVTAIAACIYACYRFRIHAQHVERLSRFFTWEAGVAWIDGDGEVVHLSERHEQAKLPAPRVQISEVNELSPEDKEVIDRSKVLTMHLEQGIGLHRIADETGIPYNKVQRWCKVADQWRSKQQQSDQEEA